MPEGFEPGPRNAAPPIDLAYTRLRCAEIANWQIGQQGDGEALLTLTAGLIRLVEGGPAAVDEPTLPFEPAGRKTAGLETPADGAPAPRPAAAPEKGAKTRLRKIRTDQVRAFLQEQTAGRWKTITNARIMEAWEGGAEPVMLSQILNQLETAGEIERRGAGPSRQIRSLPAAPDAPPDAPSEAREPDTRPQISIAVEEIKAGKTGEALEDEPAVGEPSDEDPAPPRGFRTLSPAEGARRLIAARTPPALPPLGEGAGRAIDADLDPQRLVALEAMDSLREAGRQVTETEKPGLWRLDGFETTLRQLVSAANGERFKRKEPQLILPAIDAPAGRTGGSSLGGVL